MDNKKSGSVDNILGELSHGISWGGGGVGGPAGLGLQGLGVLSLFLDLLGLSGQLSLGRGKNDNASNNSIEHTMLLY